MDGGFRASQSADRRSASRPTATSRSTQPAAVETKEAPTHQVAPTHHEPKKKRSGSKIVKLLLVFLVVVLLAVGGWFAWTKLQTTSLAIDGGKYQAVFFSNGQVYFGKLHAMNGDYLKLTNVFYLQSDSTDKKDSENPQNTSNGSGSVQLIKLGEEIHGPEDEMVISKEQVLFYENLKSDGKVAQSIDKYIDSKKK